MSPTARRTAPSATPRVTNAQEHEAAINQLIAWNQAPDAADNPALAALADAVTAYEEAAGHRPDAPQTLRGILEVEMFKRRIRQRQLAEILDVTEPRLSELMKGKREMNLDFARRLHTILHIPAEVVLQLSA
ncbi:helix-turn-helix domain-containing protein [Hymenobacter sedentarius]|uniref:helix-turn-helix domain-containing protein n=1 Tax=Hymenobacter sedentarius TaxID=1411621 RepID=UPI0009005721|nr:helix-turn-helix transcriptional regulator [Hymenobacter sedentarius]